MKLAELSVYFVVIFQLMAYKRFMYTCFRNTLGNLGEREKFILPAWMGFIILCSF